MKISSGHYCYGQKVYISEGPCLVIMAVVWVGAWGRGGGGRGGHIEHLALGKDGEKEVIVQVDSVESQEVSCGSVKLLLRHLERVKTVTQQLYTTIIVTTGSYP